MAYNEIPFQGDCNQKTVLEISYGMQETVSGFSAIV